MINYQIHAPVFLPDYLGVCLNIMATFLNELQWEYGNYKQGEKLLRNKIPHFLNKGSVPKKTPQGTFLTALLRCHLHTTI